MQCHPSRYHCMSPTSRASILFLNSHSPRKAISSNKDKNAHPPFSMGPHHALDTFGTQRVLQTRGDYM